jgi:hypothetical protein
MPRPTSRSLLFRWAPLIMALSPSVLPAQEVQAPPSAARTGFQLLNLSGYGVYYSSSLPSTGYQLGSAQLLSYFGGGGSAQLGWMRFGDRSSFSFVYTPSFTGRTRYSELNALNHAASFTAITHPAPLWALNFSTNGDYTSVEQFLFSPTVYSSAVAASGEFSDLASAILAGRFSTPQLASIFTSAPTAQSPLRILLYGQRMFTVGGQISASYSHSPRLSFIFTGNSTRNQQVQENGLINAGHGLLADGTSASGSASFNYSLSPLTQLSGTVTATRSFSSSYEGYSSMSILSVGRTFAGRWLLQARGGIGFSKPLRLYTPGPLSTVAKPVGGGSIGFRALSNTFLASFDRMVSDSYSDTYGTGALTRAKAGGTWRWFRPGNSWWVEGGGEWEQLQGRTAAYNVSAWRTRVGVGRILRAHISLLTNYVYYYGRTSGSPYDAGQSAVRVSVVWTPHPGSSR